MVTLYKLDSKNKIRVLEISTHGSKLIQTSGLIYGKKVTNTSECVGKNIGRANATTDDFQAILEAKSKVREKLKRGYFETMERALHGNVILPMLALDIKKLKKPIDWKTAYVQPKLDGMRCLGTANEMKSRKNIRIDTMPHIQAELNDVINGFYLDGELYKKGDSFQENMKLIKKYREEVSEQVKYHVYDLVSKTLPFKGRYDLLKMYVIGLEHIELVSTFKVNSMEEVDKYHTQFLSEGYEGTIIRWGTEGYEVNKRSKHLLKKKDFIDTTAKIVNVIPEDKRPHHGKFVCVANEDDITCKDEFTASYAAPHKEREKILINKENYIGKIGEIRYFETTDKGLPRFGNCHGFRLDK
jgi:DNA ligase-1